MKIYVNYMFHIFLLLLLLDILKASAAPDGGDDPKEYNEEDKCYQTEPTKDIRDDCIKGNKPENKVCCYMTIKYKYNTFYACYPVEKDKKKIEEEIKEIKKDYTDCKSISIDCKSSITKYNLIFLLLLILI